MASILPLSRKMGLRILAVGVAALLTTGGSGQKRLAPEEAQDGPHAEYDATLREVLKDIYRPDIRVRAVVRRSFQIEYAVGLRQSGNSYEIVTLRPSQQVWTYEVIKLMKSGRMGRFRSTGEDGSDELMSGELVDVTAEEIVRLQQDLPENPADLPVARCTAPIDDETAAVLLRAWRRMLSEVRSDEKALPGADGTTYVFSMPYEGQTLAGETWSPKRGTRPAKLAAVAEAMLAFCGAKDASGPRRIARMARALGGKSAGHD